jgi:RNA-directed DNA polymerase
MMHGRGKSDSAIVAAKLVNKAGRLAAESVERRVGAKGKAAQRNTRRAQDRESDSQARTAFGKSQRKGRRRSSLRSSTISVSICLSRRSSNSRTTPRPVWMG